MATLNISIPDEMQAFIETHVDMGEYQSANDYLRDLIRHKHEETEKLLVDGINSGVSKLLNMASLKKKGSIFTLIYKFPQSL